MNALNRPPEDPVLTEDSTMYAQDGLVVIGSEYASSSNSMMMFSDANGSIAAVAFDNGDNDWHDEAIAALAGAQCVASVAGILLSEGALAPMLGVSTAISCATFATQLGFLAHDYGQQSASNSYTMSVQVNLNGDNTNYITYTYPTGYYTTTYNPDTGETGAFVWHWKTGPK